MNVAISKKGSNEVKRFVRDCVRIGNNFYGSNCSLIGIKPRHWDITWTEDDLVPTLITEGKVVAWNKAVSDIIPSPDQPVGKAEVTKRDYCEAFKIRQLIDRFSYQEVEDHIEANVTDLDSAKVYLKRLSKVVLALAKIVDKEGQP